MSLTKIQLASKNTRYLAKSQSTFMKRQLEEYCLNLLSQQMFWVFLVRLAHAFCLTLHWSLSIWIEKWVYYSLPSSTPKIYIWISWLKDATCCHFRNSGPKYGFFFNRVSNGCWRFEWYDMILDTENPCVISYWEEYEDALQRSFLEVKKCYLNLLLKEFSWVYCQAQPHSQPQLGCSWFYYQLLCQAGHPE